MPITIQKSHVNFIDIIYNYFRSMITLSSEVKGRDYKNRARISGIVDNFKTFTFPLDTHEHGPRIEVLFKDKTVSNL